MKGLFGFVWIVALAISIFLFLPFFDFNEFNYDVVLFSRRINVMQSLLIAHLISMAYVFSVAIGYLSMLLAKAIRGEHNTDR